MNEKLVQETKEEIEMERADKFKEIVRMKLLEIEDKKIAIKQHTNNINDLNNEINNMKFEDIRLFSCGISLGISTR
jgi:hypothetical protein